MFISFVDNLHDNKIKHIEFSTFEDFRDTLLDPRDRAQVETKDELPLFCAARFIEDGCKRWKNNVVSVGVMVFDLDGSKTSDGYPIPPKKSDVFALSAKLQDLGIAHFIYTTHSYRGDENNYRCRLVIKLSGGVILPQWKAFWFRVYHHFGLEGLADPKCKDACRIYFPPAVHPEFADTFESHVFEGIPLDIGEVLDLPLPEELPNEPESDFETTPPEDRAEITPELVELWDAKLVELCDRIRYYPWDVGMRHLRNDAVFALACWCPHIGDPKKLEKQVIAAFDRYYDKHAHDPRAEEWREQAHHEVRVAIRDGQENPWWPRREDNEHQRDLTAAGVAERMLDARMFDKLRWDIDAKCWIAFDGRAWRHGSEELALSYFKIATDRVEQEERDLFASLRRAREAYDLVKDDDGISDDTKEEAKIELDRLVDRVDRIHKFVKACRNGQHRKAALEFYACAPEAQCKVTDFDRDPVVISFVNGTVNLRNFTFHKHRASDMLTGFSPYVYEPTAQCPRFLKFLDEVCCENEDRKRLVLRALGYSLTGLTQEQRFFYLLGNGQDGKSTLLSVVSRLLGGYGHKMQSKNLLDDKFDQHPAWLMSLAGRRLVWAEEPKASLPLNEALVKEITGGGLITARRMREAETSFVLTSKLWMAGNHLPRIVGIDHGIWRRLVVIPFEASFKETARLNMEGELLEEAPGIIALLVREAHAYLKEGITYPDFVREEVHEQRVDMSPLADFLSARCVVRDDLEKGRVEWSPDVVHYFLSQPEKFWRIDRTDTYEFYVDWLDKKRSAVTKLGPRTFYRALQERLGAKSTIKVDGVTYFKGIHYKSPLDTEIIRGTRKPATTN